MSVKYTLLNPIFNLPTCCKTLNVIVSCDSVSIGYLPLLIFGPSHACQDLPSDPVLVWCELAAVVICSVFEFYFLT